MTRTRRPLLLFALALLFAAGLGAWQGRQGRGETPAAAAVVDAPARVEAAPALPEAFTDAPPVPELPGLPPLPPASMRLGEAWPALEARALAGDWRAGCRLADALAGCVVPGRTRDALYVRAGIAGTSLAPDCSDVPTSLLRRRAIYRLAAALAGHRASAERFVDGDDFPAEDPSGAASEPALIAYRDHYTALRMQLLELGSIAAANGGLASSYRMRGDGPTPAEEAMLQAALSPHGEAEGAVAPGAEGERVRRWLERIPPDVLADWRRPSQRDMVTASDRAYALRRLGLGDPTCPTVAP